MMTIHRTLVVGASGQLGFEVSRLASQAGSETLAVSRSLPTDWHACCPWEGCDFSSFDALSNIIRDFKPSLIINALAYTATEKAEDEPDLAFHLNDRLPQFLASLDQPFSLVHYSSDYVYNDTGEAPLTESTPCDPQSVYAKSKLAGDLALLKHPERQAWIFRTSWVYSHRGKNFLKTMLNLFQIKEQLRVVDDQVGTPNSAYFLAKTTLDALKHQVSPGLYHLSQSGFTSWWGFAQAIHAMTADTSRKCQSILPCSSSEYPSRILRPSNSRLDCSKLSSALNLATLQSWQDGLRHEISQCNVKIN